MSRPEAAQSRFTPTTISAVFTVAGLALVVAGVRLVDSNTDGHEFGAAMVAVGAAVLVSIPVGFVIMAAQRRHEDRRAAEERRYEHQRAVSEREIARLSAIDMALLTTQDLTGIDLSRLVLRNRYLVAKVFDRANLASCDLSGCNLSYTSLRDADLTGAVLDGTDLTDVDLAAADLTGASLRGVAGIGSVEMRDVLWDETTVWPDGFAPSAPDR